jgi:hypothetical protein
MTTMAMDILATFTTPESIGNGPWTMLWALPLIASIATVYKATKVNSIRPKSFIKGTLSLFGSIVGFLFVSALILCAAAWFFNEKMASFLN